MKTIEQVRDALAEVFQGLKQGTIKNADAAEMNNAAGKMISSAKVELEYYALRKEKPDIPFLNKPGR